MGIAIGVFSVIGVMTAIRTLESSVESGLNVLEPIHSVLANCLQFNLATVDDGNIETGLILLINFMKD